MRSLASALRQAMRRLARNPGLATGVILTLAVGIGSVGAVYPVVEALFFRPLPFGRPERLVAIPGAGFVTRNETLQVPESLTNGPLRAAAFYSTGTINAAGPIAPRRVVAAQVSGAFFKTLEVPPLLGRWLTDADVAANRTPVAVLSEAFWRDSLASSPSVIGSRLLLGGQLFTVIGVMPEGFGFPPGVSVWVPVAVRDTMFSGAVIFRFFGRLRDGYSAERAAVELRTRLDSKTAGARTAEHGIRLEPVRELIFPNLGRPALFLQLAAALLLFSACANASSLLLADGVRRGGEVAVRRALGAGRGQLTAQLLAESSVVALAGGTLGWAFAEIGWRLLAAIFGQDLAVLPTPSPLRNLAVALMVSALVSVVTTLPLARQFRKVDVSTLLGRGATSTLKRATRLRIASLVAFQVTASFVLLAGIAALTKSYARVSSVPVGFDGRGLLALETSLAGPDYISPTRRRAFVYEGLAALEAIPSVRATALTASVPLAGLPSMRVPAVTTAGDAGNAPLAAYRGVTPGYFRAMGIPVIAGREFVRDDERRQPTPIIVNRSLARRLWRDSPAIGRRIRLSEDATEPQEEVVGTVDDVRHDTIESAPVPEVFVLYGTDWTPKDIAFVLRADSTSTAITDLAREAIARLDPQLPVRARAGQDLLRAATGRRRAALSLLVLFGCAAILLVTAGQISSVAFNLSIREKEHAIRLAVGATPFRIRAALARATLLCTGAGIAAGLATWLVVARWIQPFLFEVGPNDARVLAVAAVFLLGLATATSVAASARAGSGDIAVRLRNL